MGQSPSPASIHRADPAYPVLVLALFRTLPPTLIMTAMFCGSGALAFIRTGDATLLWLTIVGAVSSALRVMVVIHGRQLLSLTIDDTETAQLERRFAITYLPFALIVGVFAARLFAVAPGDFRILAAVLVVGYAAGVSAGVYVRPRICVPAIVLSVTPIVLVIGSTAVDTDRWLALVLAAFAAGGIESAMSRYRAEQASIAQRQRLGSMTRLDELTRLPNQLALLDEIESSLVENERSWLHLIEVEGLAVVNRDYGHQAGDALLIEIATRLAGAVGNRGFLAHLSGGQFCILQPEIFDRLEVTDLLKRVADALVDPFTVEGRIVPTRACRASVEGRAGTTATALLAEARLVEREEMAARTVDA